MIAISFPSCTGILGGVYDTPSKDFGFVESWGNSGTIYLDCDSKKKWTYLDLKNKKFETRHIDAQYGFLSPRSSESGVVCLDLRNEDQWHYLDFDKNGLKVISASDKSAELPSDWDIAVRDFDFKTNGAAVALVDYTTVFDMVWAYNPTIKEPNKDKGEVIPGRKDPGDFITDKEGLNPCLNSWLSEKDGVIVQGKMIYDIRLKDGSHAIVKLLGHKNDVNVEGILTLQYTLLDHQYKVIDKPVILSDGPASGDPTDGNSADEPENWDFAIHRYDVKTNNAMVMKTEYTTFNQLMKAEKPSDDRFKADAPGFILYDMSYMMSGAMINVDVNLSHEMQSWLDVDMRSMPPIYTPSDNVFLVKEADGTYYALKLVKYGSGRITINYLYPVEFE